MNKLNEKISKLPKGKIIFINDFLSLGSDVVIRQSLKRLSEQKKLIHLAHGIYYRPKEDELLGIIYPSTEQIAEAIARRDKARIIPTGSFALYKLGLSTQIPLNVVYLTDGSPRKIEIGKQKITFKKTSPKNLAVNHRLSNLIIEGLRELGPENITQATKQKLKSIIQKSDEVELVKKKILYAPVWIQNVVLQIINSNND
jgi:hypothetical protein